MRRIFISLLLLISVPARADLTAPIKKIEERVGGRLGVYVFDTKNQKSFSYRGDERFLMCSTFKTLLAAQVLHRADQKIESLATRVHFTAKDLLQHSPITEKNLKVGMTIEALAAAAVQHSDNAAANLLLKRQGGPKGLTEFLKSIGDQVTRLDRTEPELNVELPGKDFDTTTPKAMAQTIERLVLGSVLTESSRSLLKKWLIENSTGMNRLKAGLPASWQIADKTGSGEDGATNDAGVIFPGDGRGEIVVVVLTKGSKRPRAEIEVAISEVGRLVSTEFRK